MASVLVTGRGTSGSFQIRGVQLGKAIGAHVEPQALHSKADLVIGVKRVSTQLAETYRGRLIWDVVDAWKQPQGNEWDEATCKQWLAAEIERIQPIAVIAPTNQMAMDLYRFNLPVLWLPHHYRPRIKENPIRPEVKVIGYEGSPAYIESWRPTIEAVCQKIGARFVVNPSELDELDVVLALRGSTGYAPRKWKSNVKLANAHGSGTPFIGSPETGYLEMATAYEFWAEDPAGLALAAGLLTCRERRLEIHEQFLKARFSLEDAAERLRKWLATI